MGEQKTGLLLDGIYERHDTGLGHPESSQRYEAITKQLRADGLVDRMEPIPAREGTDEEILSCHTAHYLETAVHDIESGMDVLSTGDTVVCAASLEVARQAVGGVVTAVDKVIKGDLERSFCAVRPPGHHATPSQGMGFCVFNNIAIGARMAQEKHGIERVAIVDWDVHHGNGTQDVFFADPSVFYFSTHQYPWYPGTGLASDTGFGKGDGSTLNAPLPAGSGMDEVGAAFRGPFLEAMEAFRPELVMISAGFDSRQGDPLGQFTLTDGHFQELTRILMGVAERYAEGRVVSVLEGGYHLKGLASAVSAHVEILCNGG